MREWRRWRSGLMSRVAVVIPARLKSSRLPNKVILPILGKAMIERVYKRVELAKGVDSIYVATDSDEVAEIVTRFGGEVIKTSHHESGTDRVAEAVKEIDADIVINVQGDEPLIEPELIESLVSLFHDSSVQFGSAMHRVSNSEDLNNPNIVKVVTDLNGDAIYFSRNPIPFCRDGETDYRNFFQHIGIYGYRRDFLQKYSNLPQSPLEKAEKLEQLRAVENGYKVRMVETDYRSFGVDTEDDLKRVERILRGES
jgi:3-deoxy-manno-octulosonate cytidylyltransferase (CMP-KDO synthetase)